MVPHGSNNELLHGPFVKHAFIELKNTIVSGIFNPPSMIIGNEFSHDVIKTFVNALQLPNARIPIKVTLEGMITDVNAVQPINASSGIAVIVDGIMTIFVQWKL